MGKRATIPASGVCAASIDFDSALAILAAHARPLGKESVSLADAGGRYLAAPVVARIDAPRRDCAAMDGYAVRDADLKSGITLLRSRGASYAGSAEPCAISAGETWRSEEHTSELQSLLRLSYAVFCLTKNKLSAYITETLM